MEIVESGQSDTTNNGGRYSINDVEAGPVTVRFSKADFSTDEVPADVVAGQTVTVNFELEPMPEPE